MKYVNPEMEIVEFDESILTTGGLESQPKDDMNSGSGGGTFPDVNGGTFY